MWRFLGTLNCDVLTKAYCPDGVPDRPAIAYSPPRPLVPRRCGRERRGRRTAAQAKAALAMSDRERPSAVEMIESRASLRVAPLNFRRLAAAFNPAVEPLRSTSVALPPLLVSASRRLFPLSGTSVLPPGPTALFFARRCARVSDIVKSPCST